MDGFVQGVWDGWVRFLAPAQNVVLAVAGPEGQTGWSAPFAVAASGILSVEVPAQLDESAGLLPGAGGLRLLAPLSQDVSASVRSSDPAALQVPATVALPAGATYAAFDLAVQDNAELDGPRTVFITATAPGLAAAAAVRIADDEPAVLALDVPARVREGDAPVQGTVSVCPAPVRAVEVVLTASEPGSLVLPATVRIPASATNASFSLLAPDDLYLDPPQTVRVSAQAPNWTPAEAYVTVEDNEPRTLALTLRQGLAEGMGVVTNGGRLALAGITRTNLAVALSNSAPTDLLVPAEVVVPAGRSYIDFDIEVVDDSALDGTIRLTITANAPGFSAAQATTTVADNDPVFLRVLPVGPLCDQNLPFSVTVYAMDLRTNLLSAFVGPLLLSARTADGRVLLPPTAMGAFNRGYWSGWLRLPEPGAGVTLRVETAGGVSGESPPFDLALYVQRSVEMRARDLVADPRRPRLYATVTGGPPGASLVVLNAETAQIEAELAVGEDARPLAVSDDGQFLYVGLDRDRAVRVLELATLNLGPVHDLAPAGGGSAVYAWDLAVAPGRPDLLAVALAEGELAARPAGVCLFEAGRLLPRRMAGTPGEVAGTLAFGDDAGRLYHGLAAAVSRLGTGAEGIADEALFAGSFADLRYAEGRLFSATGDIHEAETGRPVQRLYLQGSLAVDSAAGRVFYLNYNGIGSYDLDTFEARESLTVDRTLGWATTNLVRWGADGFAAHDDQRVFIIRSGRLLPEAAPGDLSVRQCAVPNPVADGSPVTVYVTIANRGGTVLRGVVATNVWPDGARLLDCWASQGAVEPQAGRWVAALGELPPRARATVRFRVQPLQAGWGTNAVTVAHASADPAPANNLSSLPLETRDGLYVPDLTVTEGDEAERWVEMPVLLSFPRAEPVSVSYLLQPQAGTRYTQVEPVSGDLRFAPGETRQSIRARVLGNRADNDDAAALVKFTNAANAPLLQAQARLIVLDNDPTPVLRASDATVVEGRGGSQSMLFQVSIEGLTACPVSFHYFTEDDTAQAGNTNDYTAVEGSLMFQPGQTNTTIVVAVRGDTDYEPDEQFHLVFDRPNDLLLATPRVTGTILNDDFGAGQFHHVVWEWEAGPRLAGEPFPVRLTAQDVAGQVLLDFPGPLRVSAGVFDDLPSETMLGEVRHDYFNAWGMPTFTLGCRFAPLRDLWVTHLRHYFGVKVTLWQGEAKLVEQVIREPGGAWAETPLETPLLLRAGVVYTLGAHTGQGAYYGDGQYYSLPYYSARGAALPSASIQREATVVETGDARPTRVETGNEDWLVDLRYVVAASQPGSVSPPVTGAFTNGVWDGDLAVNLPGRRVFLQASDERGQGSVTGLFPVFAANDLVVEAAANVALASVGQQVTNTFTVFNVGPAVATGVALQCVLPRGVQVAGATSSQGTVASGEGEVSFALGALTGGARAWAQVVWVAAEPGSVTNRAELQRAEPDALPANNTAALVTEVHPVPSIQVADAWTEVMENAGAPTNLVFTMRLSGPAGQPVSVHYATADGSATSGADYLAVSGDLLFPPGETLGTVTVSVLPNQAGEPEEKFYLELSRAVNARLDTPRATATIYDNHPLPAVSAEDTWVVEGDQEYQDVAFKVRLSRPTATLVVGEFALAPRTARPRDWSLYDPFNDDYIECWGGFSFLPGQVESEIPISIIGDRVHEADEYLQVFCSVTSGATVAKESAALNILDDDPEPTLTVTAYPRPEGNPGEPPVELPFEFVLSGLTAVPVWVSYETLPDTAEADVDYVFQSGFLQFPVGVTRQTISVPLLPDTQIEPDERFYLNLTSVSGALAADTLIAATIANDDFPPGQPRALALAPIPSPQTPGQPFWVRISVRNAQDELVPGFNGQVALTAWSGPGSQTGTLLGARGSTNARPDEVATFGLEFIPNQPLRVTHLRHYFGVVGALWRADGALLARITLQSEPGQWRESPLPAPVLLEAGQRYIVSAYTGSEVDYQEPGLCGPFAHGTLRAAWCEMGDHFPTGDMGNLVPLVDLRYETIPPEPRPLTLLPANAPAPVLVNGLWEGRAALGEPAADVFLTAVTPQGLSGASDRFQVLAFADNDHDGLDDHWESRHSLNPQVNDADADPDGDGLPNRAEWLAGTDPDDPQSRLHLKVAALPDGQVVLRLPTEPGRKYQLESSATLAPGDWGALGEPLAGTGAVVEVPIPVGGPACGFHRVRLLPAP